VDPTHGEFFMRVEIELAGFRLTPDNFASAWQPFADRFAMRWSIHWGNITKRMAIFVSRQSHCLNDLLWRWRSGELRAEIPLVISNHPDGRDAVERFGLEFHHLPVTPQTRGEQEGQATALLEAAGVDVIVLARYMQVLTPAFVSAWPNRVINIHHSFLPAFAGQKPYHQAYERGVKIIGATSHYVTDELDEGPIIAQATLGVDHRDTIDDLVRKGRDLERVVLATAVRLHLEDKILASRNKTVVFD
jgi:formyltetrahydrofolate deformylase